jgi:hypothetical protein
LPTSGVAKIATPLKNLSNSYGHSIKLCGDGWVQEGKVDFKNWKLKKGS